MATVFVLGLPCVGKTHFCRLSKELYGLQHISLGECLRKSEKWKPFIEDSISKGLLVDSAIVNDILQENLNNSKGLVIVDGFPRSFENLIFWEKTRTDPIAVFYLTCSEDVRSIRYTKRVESEDRIDDYSPIRRRRDECFYNNTLPVLNFYNSKGLVCCLDTDQENLASKGLGILQSMLTRNNKGLEQTMLENISIDNTELKFKKLSSNATTPRRGSCNAAGFDLFSAESKPILSNGHDFVQTDIAIILPRGTYGRIAPRSGLAVHHSINIGGGVIDPDYRGNVGVILFNHSQTTFHVSKGDKIAQLLVEKICLPKLVEVHELENTERGVKGYGSTGRS